MYHKADTEISACLPDVVCTYPVYQASAENLSSYSASTNAIHSLVINQSSTDAQLQLNDSAQCLVLFWLASALLYMAELW